MRRKVILGIDTSNYTTSLAAVTIEGALLANLKIPLTVEAGECGLRQSDALFLHTKNIPVIMRELSGVLGDEYTPVAIGVSDKPRSVEGSYMPVFLAGVSAAESISAAMGIPLYRFSHQCGHIMAALFSAGRLDLKDTAFPAFHVSGGTTELVRVTPADGSFHTELVGGTLDLSAGQAIDRIGVMMDMPFPAGMYMEECALHAAAEPPRKKVAGAPMHVNLSGLQNMAQRLYSDTSDKNLVSRFVLDYIADALIKMAEDYKTIYGDGSFIFAGGVMSNSIIKEKIKGKLEAYFAEPALSADNAVGVAVLAREQYLK